MMSPREAELHDDHVHVRISCPESMHDVCVEEATGPAAPAGGDEKPGGNDGGDPQPATAAADSGAGEAK
jgi:penicillin-insensitive murein endopeptidase